MPPKSIYTGKMPTPFSVRLSKGAAQRLNILRREDGLSQGDLIEQLIRDEERPELAQRHRIGGCTERVSFRMTEIGNVKMRDLMRENHVSGGDLVEAYLRQAAYG